MYLLAVIAASRTHKLALLKPLALYAVAAYPVTLVPDIIFEAAKIGATSPAFVEKASQIN